MPWNELTIPGKELVRTTVWSQTILRGFWESYVTFAFELVNLLLGKK